MRAEIYWIPDAPHGRLAIMPRPRGDDWLGDELASLRSCGVDVLVSLLRDDEIVDLGLQDEPSLCSDAELTFVSHPIDDRGVPASVDDFLSLVQQLQKH